eukprot:621807-Prymnesium_polylepis.1
MSIRAALGPFGRCARGWHCTARGLQFAFANLRRRRMHKFREHWDDAHVAWERPIPECSAQTLPVRPVSNAGVRLCVAHPRRKPRWQGDRNLPPPPLPSCRLFRALA